MDAFAFFSELIQSRGSQSPMGICSVCSAHPLVLRAAMENAAEYGAPVLIEATTNQVNQFGGYTGMHPANFVDFVHDVAENCGYPRDNIILGGDHLGPFVWRDRPEKEAMALACQLVRAYVQAGFVKIHLDTSMPLGDDEPGVTLDDEVIARRGAVLCSVAEQAWRQRRKQYTDAPAPVYVIGSEVPAPGGPQQAPDQVPPTPPRAFLASLGAFRSVFKAQGLQSAFERIVAFVVQPGVEFTGDAVFDYDSAAARQLCGALRQAEKALVFEGHSTDYQMPEALSNMVRDGFGILKVGPALTFALREGLFALEQMEREMLCGMQHLQSAFGEVLEEAMLADDKYWRGYCGAVQNTYLARRYSYFDRARYYLPQPEVAAAQQRLLDNLSAGQLPAPLVKQYLPSEYEDIRRGALVPEATALLLAHIKRVLRDYMVVCCCQL